MLRSEKKSFLRFLLIYLGSTFLLFFISIAVFYHYQKHQILDQQMQSLRSKADTLKSHLRLLHESYESPLAYPEIAGYDSAIYDLERRYIFGTFPSAPSLEHLTDSDDLHYYIAPVEPYYLGAAYLLVAKPVDHAPIQHLQKTIVWFMVIAGIAFSALGIFLGRLFVAPMRESITTMNRFIQDTTHELNTPISTILANIEMLETFGKCKGQELKRIEIASRTLSRIYDDLTYLNLNHRYYRDIRPLDLSALLRDRILYFDNMARAKSIRFDLMIEPGIEIAVDHSDAVRLIDNLIANAVKYNRQNGTVTITLTPEYLRIRDSGIGIAREKIDTIFDRFARGDSAEGGFGIGLHIVRRITEDYRFGLQLESNPNQGTEVTIRWSKES